MIDTFLPFAKNKQIVVLLSGGMDSTLAFLIAHRVCEQQNVTLPIGLFVDLNQPYRNKEISILERLKSRYPKQIRGLSAKVINAKNNNIPSIDVAGKAQIVPGRNMTLATLGANYGDDLWICADVSTLHHGQMADKSYRFFEVASRALSVTFDKAIVVRSPVGHLTKAELISLAINLGIPTEQILDTSTCYHPDVTRCGECLTCVQRWVATTLNDLQETHKTPPDKSEYMASYVSKLKDAWERQDFSHYTEKRISEVFKALQLPLDYPFMFSKASNYGAPVVAHKLSNQYLSRPNIPKSIFIVGSVTKSYNDLDSSNHAYRSFTAHHPYLATSRPPHEVWEIHEVASIEPYFTDIREPYLIDFLSALYVYCGSLMSHLKGIALICAYGGVYTTQDTQFHAPILSLLNGWDIVCAPVFSHKTDTPQVSGLSLNFMASTKSHPALVAYIRQVTHLIRAHEIRGEDVEYTDREIYALLVSTIDAYADDCRIRLLAQDETKYITDTNNYLGNGLIALMPNGSVIASSHNIVGE